MSDASYMLIEKERALKNKMKSLKGNQKSKNGKPVDVVHFDENKSNNHADFTITHFVESDDHARDKVKKPFLGRFDLSTSFARPIKDFDKKMKHLWTTVPVAFASQFLMVNPAFANGFEVAPPGFENMQPVGVGFPQNVIEINK